MTGRRDSTARRSAVEPRPSAAHSGGMQPVGVVLCGGASLRMGRDKATIGDPPWAHRVATALQEAGCATVELQGGSAALGTTSWRQVPDTAPGGGPVPAMVQAAARNRRHPMLVASCDLPNLGSPAVTKLMDALTGADAVAAAYRVAGRANWSLVALEASFVERLAALNPLDVVGHSVQSLLGADALIVEPGDPIAVTDIDEPPALPSTP